jgi:hypothetical protein
MLSCGGFSLPPLYHSTGWPLCVFVTIDEAWRYLVTSIDLKNIGNTCTELDVGGKMKLV